MLEGIAWLVQNVLLAFVNLARSLLDPGAWLNWSDPEAVMRFVYYGGSVEFFFVIFALFPTAAPALFNLSQSMDALLKAQSTEPEFDLEAFEYADPEPTPESEDDPYL